MWPYRYRQAGSGHLWGALNHPTIMGLAAVNSSLAWDVWMDTTLHNQATLHPTYWPGVWSSADYIRVDGLSGGSAFPVLCTHRHAWQVAVL